jgi:hypothetical protein
MSVDDPSTSLIIQRKNSGDAHLNLGKAAIQTDPKESRNGERGTDSSREDYGSFFPMHPSPRKQRGIYAKAMPVSLLYYH